MRPADFPLMETARESSLFWSSYITHRGMSQRDAARFADTCIDMMVARLLVAAYETCFQVDQMPPICHCLLKLAILCEGPERDQVKRAFTSRPEMTTA